MCGMFRQEPSLRIRVEAFLGRGKLKHISHGPFTCIYEWPSPNACTSLLDAFSGIRQAPQQLTIRLVPVVVANSANSTFNICKCKYRRVQKTVRWWDRPVDELLQAHSPLLDEGLLKDALVSTKRQQSFQSLTWQRGYYNLEEGSV